MAEGITEFVAELPHQPQPVSLLVWPSSRHVLRGRLGDPGVIGHVPLMLLRAVIGDPALQDRSYVPDPQSSRAGAVANGIGSEFVHGDDQVHAATCRQASLGSA
jgi:hypothetical protein